MEEHILQYWIDDTAAFTECNLGGINHSQNLHVCGYGPISSSLRYKNSYRLILRYQPLKGVWDFEIHSREDGNYGATLLCYDIEIMPPPHKWLAVIEELITIHKNHNWPPSNFIQIK